MAPAAVLASMLADAPLDPTSATSPVAQLVTVTLAGIAAIITAIASFASARRRRQSEADAMPLPPSADPEDRLSRIRDRVTVVETQLKEIREHRLPDRTTVTETRLGETARRVGDLEERMDLRRAADVVIEAEAAPRRRRKRPEETP
jgi:hypothetical protein